VDDGALSAERWFGGPATNRRAYAVDDVAGLREDANTVVRAERLPAADEPDAYAGPVSLKLHTDTATIDALQLAARLAAVAAVRHPNLGRPIEAFVGPGLARRPEDADTADDVFYVAAEWEDGRPLRTAVPMAPLAAVAVVRGVAGAVDALHRHGLTHRDLHPGNIIVRPDGSPVVIDFDTVRPDDGAATTTIAGVVGFIAPETVTGGSGRDADCWSVGMLAVYALLGHPQGSTPSSVLRRELETALAGTGDGRHAAAGVMRMIDPDPERRPPDIVDWVDRLERDVQRHRLPWRHAIGAAPTPQRPRCRRRRQTARRPVARTVPSPTRPAHRPAPAGAVPRRRSCAARRARSSTSTARRSART
jgi:serine/threonine protein kinase